MNNYPPDVTGNEYAIAGPLREWEEERECPHCGWFGPMSHEYHPEFGTMAWCRNPVKHILEQDGFVVEPDDMEPEPDLDRDPYDVYGTPEHEFMLMQEERNQPW